ncbi:MAG TPA: TIGR02147 family protein [Bdellovibrionales bacterium]|nr:TIGR02147 family protein [Bdellovibrionales bacterium]
METHAADPRTWMLTEYAVRKKKNPSLSLRGFARYLGIPASRLSEVFSGKREMTPGMGVKIAARLAYDPETKKKFLATISSDKKSATDQVDIPEFQQLTVDAFCVISDWYHFALLSLIETADFDSEPSVIAKRLGISVSEVRLALERLERLSLIEATKNSWRRTANNLTTTHDVRSTALRHGHRQLLEKSIDALEDVEIEQRDITSMTMAIDPKKLPEAKKMITDFRRKLCGFLEKGKQSEVYALCIQLVPLTKELK